MVIRHRPDILFLGDLVTSLDLIGRLKKRLEADLHDECFVTTNISALQGRPVGIGAVIHCSLANILTDCVLHYPNGGTSEPSMQEWSASIEGRILCVNIWEFAPKIYPKISFHIPRYPKISLNSNK